MTRRSRQRVGMLLLAFAVLIGSLSFLPERSSSAAEGQVLAAVESDMHEFMEYVFEPPYKRLKAALTAEPKDKQAWKVIKSDSLILAEACNLLHGRGSKDGAVAWSKLANATRQQGGTLYQSAKKRDYATSKADFGKLLIRCNACHDEFADGKHQLSP